MDSAARAAAVVDGQIADADHVQLLRGSDVVMEPIDWLWPGYLARGKFHLLAGRVSQGKTTLAMALAATVTTGAKWPDGEPCKLGRVLVFSAEDDIVDTLAPRLRAAGADLSRVLFVKGTRSDGKDLAFDPARDLDLLRAAILGDGDTIDLIIADPVVGAVKGDGNSNTDTRRDLEPLAALARECRAAVIGITHFRKNGGGADPVQMVIGSTAFVAVARIVLVAAKVKDAEGNLKHILARAKSNIGPDDGGFEYHIEEREIEGGIHATCATWGAPITGSARDLLIERDPAEEEDVADVVGALREELKGAEWRPVSDLHKSLIALGFTKTSIWRASKRLRVRKRKAGMVGGWEWQLPGEAES